MSIDAKQIEMVAPQRLTAHPRNVREHSQTQIDRIAKSIQNFGFTAPVLCNEEYVILSGHGRTQAAIKLGLAQIPVRMITGLSDAQQRAMLIADNKLTDVSYFDTPALKVELIDLDTGEIDLTLTGFSQAELANLLGTTAAAPPEEKPEEKELPVARVGDVWKLGSNYLIVGAEDDDNRDMILEDADKILKAWQKANKAKAALHITNSDVRHSL